MRQARRLLDEFPWPRAKGALDTGLGPEQVADHGLLAALEAAKQQGRAPGGDYPAMDFGAFQLRIDLGRDFDQLPGPAQGRKKGAQVECRGFHAESAECERNAHGSTGSVFFSPPGPRHEVDRHELEYAPGTPPAPAGSVGDTLIMKQLQLTLAVLLTLPWASVALAQAKVAAGTPAPAGQSQAAVVWDAAAAEHLLNRAGFGARPAQIARAVELGHAAVVESLLAPSLTDPVDPFAVVSPPRPSKEDMQAMGEEERREAMNQVRRHAREQLAGFAGWWIDQMIEGHDPLRERMTLFWHGYFTSSFQDVKNTQALIAQNELLRKHALGNFGDLVRGIIRDPAMLEYLDNNQNKKASPNENFARELMELFTLGEGNYSEADIKEAARALTGWVRRNQGPDVFAESEFRPGQHDKGVKTVLGVTGKLGADELAEILLDQPACPRWVAGKLLVYLEGREPSAERLEEYARSLRENNYEIAPFLRKLFLDPSFFAQGVRASRIASPIDYLVGTCRRLSIRPPGQLVWLAAGQIGQRLFDPPNVKGWEGGKAWITTSTLLARGNLSGMLLGVVRWEDVMADDALVEEDPSMDSMEGGASMEGMANEMGPGAARRTQKGAAGNAAPKLGEMGRFARYLGEGFRPNINLGARCKRAKAHSDEQIIDFMAAELLAVDLMPESRDVLREFLAQERQQAPGRQQEQEPSAKPGAKGQVSEESLRKLAHLILSLPEAQLH